MEEEKFAIAQANEPLKKTVHLKELYLPCRQNGEFLMIRSKRSLTTWMFPNN